MFEFGATVGCGALKEIVSKEVALPNLFFLLQAGNSNIINIQRMSTLKGQIVSIPF